MDRFNISKNKEVLYT